jgi:hypothetical protein
VQVARNESREREQDTYYVGSKYIQPATSLFCDWKAWRWVLKPKEISKQAVEVSSKGGGRRAGGCCSCGVDVETSEKDAKVAAIVRPVRG